MGNTLQTAQVLTTLGILPTIGPALAAIGQFILDGVSSIYGWIFLAFFVVSVIIFGVGTGTVTATWATWTPWTILYLIVWILAMIYVWSPAKQLAEKNSRKEQSQKQNKECVAKFLESCSFV